MGFWNFVTGSTPAGIISETGQKIVAGVFEGVTGLIQQFNLSPEEKKRFELALLQMQLDSYKAQISDTQSARQMQMTNPSIWPGIITFIMLFGFFGVMLMIILKGMPSMNESGGQALLLLIGTLNMGFGVALHFWMGGTKQGQTKDEMLANSIPTNMVKALDGKT